jgi:hypothetical protein
MVFEVRDLNNITEVRCSDYNSNVWMNIIDIRMQMSRIMKLYKETSNETTKVELVKTFTILEKMVKYL